MDTYQEIKGVSHTHTHTHTDRLIDRVMYIYNVCTYVCERGRENKFHINVFINFRAKKTLCACLYTNDKYSMCGV